MKILIVDDSALIRRTIGKTAIGLGLETIEAENGADALAKLRKHSQEIGIIVLDWNMPIMDGYEALTKIKSGQKYMHIPVLMATSAGVQEDVVKALKAGAASYLIKPFKPEALSAKISELVNIPPVNISAGNQL